MGGAYFNFKLEIPTLIFFKFIENTTQISVKNWVYLHVLKQNPLFLDDPI